VLDLLIRIREERGLTLLMVTHSPEVSQRADRVVRMLDGHVVSQESPAISKKN
jgi:putative ABC transport system ATP-binding protein